MIKLQNLVPKVYNNQSRDFQLLSRLYDLVLNSVKTNADLIYNYPISENSDQKLIDLMALTLGFKSKHNYNLIQLTALCSAFSYIIKHKGSIESIISACNTLISAEGISNTVEYELTNNNTDLTLYIPQEVSDINLLKDLLVYILPAGMSCNFVKETRIIKQADADLGFVSNVECYTNTNEPAENSWLFVPNADDIQQRFEESEHGYLQDIQGILGNTVVYKPKDKETQ